jgi:hypothetical protein
MRISCGPIATSSPRFVSSIQEEDEIMKATSLLKGHNAPDNIILLCAHILGSPYGLLSRVPIKILFYAHTSEEVYVGVCLFLLAIPPSSFTAPGPILLML